jgi:hypothetical protein
VPAPAPEAHVPAPAPEAHAAAPGGGPQASPPPPQAAARQPADPSAELAARMTALLNSFAAWARDHAGAACPKPAALGTVKDPWGNPLLITCTAQPADQIVGAISAGPDGKLGTSDDIGSWQLGRDVTDAVRGARWVAAPPQKQPRPTRPQRDDKDDIPRVR